MPPFYGILFLEDLEKKIFLMIFYDGMSKDCLLIIEDVLEVFRMTRTKYP